MSQSWSPFRLMLLFSAAFAATAVDASPRSVSPDGPWESGIVLLKLAPDVGTVVSTVDLSTPAIDRLSANLAEHLLSSGVRFVEPIFPSFDPQIRDRQGLVTTAMDGSPRLVPNDLTRWIRASVEAGTEFTAVEMLLTDPIVIAAEPNYLRSTCDLSWSFKEGGGSRPSPADTYFFPEQWGYENQGQYCGVARSDINAIDAWDDYGVGVHAATTRVGVIDTGIDPLHPDLSNVGEGVNFVFPSDPPVDDNNHGTACAGLVGMDQGNNRGGTGVAPGVEVVPVKVLDSTGYGYTDWIAQGIDWCRSEGIPVVSMSLGGSEPTTLEKEALQNNSAAGITNIAAAGNTNDDEPHYPAAYSRLAVAVNAYVNTGARWADSEFGGPDWQGSTYGSWIDLSAPGGRGIMTTKRHIVDGGYYDLATLNPWDCTENNWLTANGFGGTSAAAPMASGVAAAILAHNPDLSGEDAEWLMIRTARDMIEYGQGRDDYSGWGSPDLEDALRYATPPYVAERATVTGGSVSNDGSGSTVFLGVPGLANGYYGFRRKKVVRTVPLTSEFLTVPLAWGRVEGSVGWHRIADGELFDASAAEPGYAEVQSISPTSITVRTWYYELFAVDGSRIGYFPNNGNVAMSYTALGPSAATTAVDNQPAVAGHTLIAYPNPTAASCRVAMSRPQSGSSLVVYDAAGRQMRALGQQVGRVAEWDLRMDDGALVPAGVYFARQELGSAVLGKCTIHVVR